MTSPATQRFPTTDAIVLVADLSGYHRGFRSHSDSDMAAFLDGFYRATEDVISHRRGRIIKFLGDAVLAVFPADAAHDAVAAAVTLEASAAVLADGAGLDLRLGANIHAGDLVMAELGSGASRRTDVIGKVVNQTFLLGRGSGIRISERVYRRLASSERSPWEKHKPPAVYVLGVSDEPYAGLRKTAAENAARW